jgi:hypothetical protein
MSYYPGSNSNTYGRLHSLKIVLSKPPDHCVIVLAGKGTLVGNV